MVAMVDGVAVSGPARRPAVGVRTGGRWPGPRAWGPTPTRCWPGSASGRRAGRAPLPGRGPTRPWARDRAIPRTLVVDQRLPTSGGGVQQYVWNLVRRLPADRVAVLAPNWPGWRDHDRRQPFPVDRWPATFMWPTRELGRRVRQMAREHGADVVLFGHGFPLPLLGPGAGPGRAALRGPHPRSGGVAGPDAGLRPAFHAGRVRRGVGASPGSTWTAEAPPPVPAAGGGSRAAPGVDPERFSPGRRPATARRGSASAWTGGRSCCASRAWSPGRDRTC